MSDQKTVNPLYKSGGENPKKENDSCLFCCLAFLFF
jgi:hypothetical protein